jgi:mRNA interferase MazF
MKQRRALSCAQARGDPKSHRTFVVVSRQVLIESKFSTVICAPVYTHGEGLATQVPIGPEEGLKHSNWIMCDNLVSLRKADLTNFFSCRTCAAYTRTPSVCRTDG